MYVNISICRNKEKEIHEYVYLYLYTNTNTYIYVNIPTRFLIQKVTEHVSGVGTVTDAMGVDVLYSIMSAERKGLLDHCSKVFEDGSYQ
jgi:hypothetical protein